MIPERIRIVMGFIIISLIWGSTWMVIKIGLQSMTPSYGVLFRFILAAGVLYGIAKWKKIEIPWGKTAIFLYLNLGLISFGIPFTLVYWGEQHIASGLASILFGFFPFIVALGSHYFLPAERLNFGKTLGVILGFIGIVIIFWSDIPGKETDSAGMIAILVSVLMQGMALIILKRQNYNISPISLTYGGLLFAIFIMAPIAIINEDISSLHFDLIGIGSIAYLGVIGTVVTLVVYYWLMKRIEIVYLSLVSFVTPIVAVILGVLILGEVFTQRMMIGGTLVLAGILAANGNVLLKFIRRRIYFRQEET